MKTMNLNFMNFLILSMVALSISAQVTIYSGANFTGDTLSVSTRNSVQLPFNVKSISVREGYMAIMANESGCTGLCQYWRNDAGEGSILGYRGCVITVRQLISSDAKIQITVKTGGDDLRNGSTANLQIMINGRRPDVLRMVVAGGSLAGNTVRTWEKNIPGISIHQILDLRLNHNGNPAASNIFETYDNWNVDEIFIRYISRSCPEGIILFHGKGTPLVRFTGETKQFSIPAISSSCN